MKIKTSKAFAKELQAQLKKASLRYTVEQIKMPPAHFRAFVDVNDFIHDNDYNYIENYFTVLKVTYPADYYACPQYLTTNDLIKVFRKSDKTFNGFFSDLVQAIEI